MRKNRLILLVVLFALAVAGSGYLYFLYRNGSTNNYQPPKPPSSSPTEKAHADLRTLSRAIDAYFIKNMAYPQKLEMLIPEFIDRLEDDPLSRKPYRYNVFKADDADHYRISVPAPSLYTVKELYIEDGTLVQK